MGAPILAERTTRRRRTPPRFRMTPRTLAHFRRDPLGFLERLALHGDFVHFRLASLTDTYLVNDPKTVHEILAVQHRQVHKSKTVQAGERSHRAGALSSEDELHATQRRLIQRAFSKAHLERYGEQMQNTILEADGRGVRATSSTFSPRCIAWPWKWPRDPSSQPRSGTAPPS